MKKIKYFNNDVRILKIKFFFELLIWSTLIIILLIWYDNKENERIIELAKKEALTAFKKDTAFRFWAAKHGGVYVPVTKETPENIYLKHIPERDIVTPSGKKLTLMNPAYMVRQLMTDYSLKNSTKGHITSLNFLNPINAPDDWESESLKKFEQGFKEVFELVPSSKGDTLRLMRPLIVKKKCLKCHEYQGYKIGEVRGGTSTTVQMSDYYRMKNDSVIRISIKYFLIWLSGIIYMGLVFRFSKNKQIERKKANTELESYRNHLEELVDERTEALKEKVELYKKTEKALEKARQEAVSANNAKSIFLANMSHELRTPLNAILGFSRLLGNNEFFKNEEKKYLEIIHSSGENLLNLINDVLDMSKIEAGHITLNKNTFDLHNLLEDVKNLFVLKAKEKNLQLILDYDSDVPQYIFSDEGRLRQVLLNFVSNAMKFTEKGGISITVKTNRLISKTKTLIIGFEIADTGEGIKQEELGKLFEPFVQTESGIKYQQGTGLGLPISRKLIRMMGGEVSVTSEVDKGSVFKFEIQAEISNDKNLKNSKKQRRVIGLEPGQSTFKLLIVDDNETNRLLLLKLLSFKGFELKEAENGKQAIEIWNDWDPHLIFMDMRMPVINGYEATKKIKGSTKGQATVIVAVTASTFEEERSIVLSAGCDEFIRKPFRNEAIFESLNRHLNIKFVYEEDNNERTSQSTGEQTLETLAPKAFEDIPEELVLQLEQESKMGYAENIKNTIELIRSHNNELADTLMIMVDNYDYEKIIEKIQMVEK